MLYRNSNKSTAVSYHKSTAFQHNMKLLDQAQRSVLVDNVCLTNSADIAANRAVFLIHLTSKIQTDDFEITQADVMPSINVYPNGIIQLNFDDMHLKPGDEIKLTYRLRINKEQTDKSEIIKKNYLFFCF